MYSLQGLDMVAILIHYKLGGKLLQQSKVLVSSDVYVNTAAMIVGDSTSRWQLDCFVSISEF